MRFCIFSSVSFEVSDPIALIEAYCFQSDFYRNYDLLLRRGDQCIQDVNEIGARTNEDILLKCKARLHKNLKILTFNLDALRNLDSKTRNNYIDELSRVIRELDAINGVGFSKATKILHTLYPKIVPMIDVPLQKVYKKINPRWMKGDWTTLLIAYYDNFLVGDTYKNLCWLQNKLSFLGLTKVRIFDILWWSFLKSENLRQECGINWTTIERV
jgi:hypothetical protein